MTTPSESLIALCQSRVPGERFPSWTVTTRSGHLVGLISEIPAGNYLRLKRAVRAQRFAALLGAGLLSIGEREAVPEYEGGSRQGMRWDSDRMGRRLTLTDEGRAVAGRWLPLDPN